MRIIKDSTIGVIVDVQERLLPVMHQRDETLAAIARFTRGLRILGAPIIVTEQYPRGLGPTVTRINDALTDQDDTNDPSGPAPIRLEKSTFSCCDDDGFTAALTKLAAAAERPGPTVLLAGIEAHVCVLQTTIDLLALGYQPVVITDATSSRSPHDRDIALRRMERDGAILTTVESVLFEMTRSSRSPRFKAISALVK